MSDLRCGCGAGVFERREYVRRRVGGGDEVIYRRYACVSCHEAVQEFMPEPEPDEVLTALVEAGDALRRRTSPRGT